MEPLRPADPAVIGGYQLLARLGAGGMGQVYFGRSSEGQTVAVKLIRAELEGAEAVARFRREVATVGRVRSPYAAALVGAEVQTPPYWLATTYVPGPTLSQAVAAAGPLSPQTALRLMTALATALADVHRQGVEHRDLKPQNVILTGHGPVLIDFGIAKGEDQTTITMTGQPVGTPGYLAPEVIVGHERSPAADVFALGCVIAYAATGRRPFGSGDPHVVIYRSVNSEVDLTGVDPDLARLVRACTAKDPQVRPSAARLVSMCGSTSPLTADPAYQRLLVTGQPPPPALLNTPPLQDISTKPRQDGNRNRGPLFAALGTGAAVVTTVGVLLLSRLFPTSHHTATSSPPPTSPRPSVSVTQTKPTQVVRNRTGLINNGVHWDPASQNCQPSTAYEETPPSDLQESAPRPGGPDQAVAGKPVQIGLRSKYGPPQAYYVAAMVNPPPSLVGNSGSYLVTRPVLLSGTDWTYFNYPTDFQNSPLPLSKGDWTVLWFHVHNADNQAYFIGCDGFTVN